MHVASQDCIETPRFCFRHSRCSAVRGVLAEFAATRNVVGCCTRKGLLKHLEAQQGELELCEKVGRVGEARK